MCISVEAKLVWIVNCTFYWHRQMLCCSKHTIPQLVLCAIHQLIIRSLRLPGPTALHVVTAWHPYKTLLKRTSEWMLLLGTCKGTSEQVNKLLMTQTAWNWHVCIGRGHQFFQCVRCALQWGSDLGPCVLAQGLEENCIASISKEFDQKWSMPNEDMQLFALQQPAFVSCILFIPFPHNVHCQIQASHTVQSFYK